MESLMDATTNEIVTFGQYKELVNERNKLLEIQSNYQKSLNMMHGFLRENMKEFHFATAEKLLSIHGARLTSINNELIQNQLKQTKTIYQMGENFQFFYDKFPDGVSYWLLRSF